jgi:hypothetical protein
VNGQPLWIVVALVSGILFLGYAKVGSRGDQPAPSAWPLPHGKHAAPPGPTAPAGPARERVPAGARSGSGPSRPWWEH